MKQLELFPSLVDERKDSEDIRNEWNKTRKALFMQNAELKKLYQEVAHDLQMLKLNICKGRLPV